LHQESDQPLYILCCSGTGGPAKPEVHKGGSIKGDVKWKHFPLAGWRILFPTSSPTCAPCRGCAGASFCFVEPKCGGVRCGQQPLWVPRAILSSWRGWVWVDQTPLLSRQGKRRNGCWKFMLAVTNAGRFPERFASSGWLMCQPWFYLRLAAYSFLGLSEGAYGAP